MFILSSLAVVSMALAVQAGPAAREAHAARDAEIIWIPHILTPNADSVWVIGQEVNVTWDTSDAPDVISNGAAVVLRQHVLLDTLVEDFDLRAGYVTLTVPDVEPATDYSIVLFGDSGNNSEEFTITA